jgi:tripartite-type tricarboxylate transporter receptor subunit TctC
MASRVASLLLAGFLAATFAPAASGQDYPDRPVRVIVPFPPGAGVDIVTRLVAARLSESMGKPFVIENRSGMAGNLGAEAVARANPDGYTLLAAPSSIAASESLYQKLSFSLVRDFEPVAMMASVPFLLVVSPSLPVKNVQELIALAKARPDELTYASTGNGSSPHLTTEMFKLQSHAALRHVPYRGTGPAIIDLLAGRVDLMFGNMLSVLPAATAGQLRGIAVSSAEPSPAAPDYPTVASQGLPAFESATWFALLAPAKTPPAIVDRLNAEIAKVLAIPEVQRDLLAQGAQPGKGSRTEVGAYIKSEVAKWGELVKVSGAKIE